MEYNQENYDKYVKRMLKDGYSNAECISFETWKFAQPIADNVVGKTNKGYTKSCPYNQ